MFIQKPKIKIVATILAKNEEDIISDTIENLLEQGIYKIIFTDNNSSDKTLEIAQKYPEICEIIEENEDTHNQSVWVTRMARMAYKLRPDWIIHIDADELWTGINNLIRFNSQAVRCESMYLHPPVNDFSIKNQRFYLDFDKIPISQECKIAHRPIEDISITHGNHGIENKNLSYSITSDIKRHHYPIRSYDQWRRKSDGHKSLQKRNSYCNRWKNWYNLFQNEEANLIWDNITNIWHKTISNGTINHSDFIDLISIWSEEDVVNMFKSNKNVIPSIGEWPKLNALPAYL